MFKPYSHSTATDYVTKQIEDLITEGTFQAGDRLPNEAELASQFNVGRSTIRESLREVERLGLIKTIRGAKGGRYIADVGGSAAGDMLRFLLDLKKITLEELVESRKINESAAVALACERRTEEDLTLMDHNIMSMEDNLSDKSIFIETNYQFHYCIAQASKNRVLVLTLQALKAVIFKHFEFIPISSDGYEIALQQHKKIFYAIKNKQADDARRLMIEHLDVFQMRIKKLNGVP